MQRTFHHKLSVILCALAAHLIPQTVAPAQDEFEITATIPEDKLRPSDRVTVSFPQEMIDAGRVWTEEDNPPLVFDPPLEFTASWQGQMEMALNVSKLLRPGTVYTLKVKENTKTLSGETVPAGEIASFETAPFEVSSWFTETSKLHERPSVDVRFTYPVNVADAVKNITLIDRDTREKFPVEATIYDSGTSEPSSALIQNQFRVAPAAPLPPGRTFDLIIEGALDAHFRTPLNGLKVVPLGTTTPPAVEFVQARNFAIEPPCILVKFTQHMDADSLKNDAIRIEPSVPNLKVLPSGREVYLHGDFKIPSRYIVHISNSAKAHGGFPLAKPEKWGATFVERQPSIVFPSESEFLFRSALGLDFSFKQSNTGELTWQLARVPIEKLPALRDRLKEFLKDAQDPLTGAPLPDERGGKLRKATEPLINAFNLETVASGTIPASTPGEVDRVLKYKPTEGEPALAGPYLLEITGTGADGRIQGNRAIVFFTENYAVQKRSATTVTLRVAKMADASPVPSAEIIAITNEGIELARGRTGNNGIISFENGALFNPDNPLGQAAYFLIRGPDGVTFAQQAQPPKFASGYATTPQQSKTLTASYITDRPLYRPGETVKIKGFVRTSEKDVLAIPQGSAQVFVYKGYQDEVVTQFEAALTDTGGWEGEWQIPDTADVGSYRIRCATGGQWANETHYIQVEEYRPPLFSVIVEEAAEAPSPNTDAVTVESVYFHGAPNAGATVRWKAEWYDASDFGFETQYIDSYSDTPFESAPLKEVTGETKLDQNGRATLVCESPFVGLPPRARCHVTWTVDVLSPEGQTLTAGISHLRQLHPAILGINLEEQIGEGVKISLSALDESDTEVPGLEAEVTLLLAEYKTVREELAPRVARYRNSRFLKPVENFTLKSGEEKIVKAGAPGEYIAIAKSRTEPVMQVSDRTTVTSETKDAVATFPVESAVQFNLSQDRRTYTVGEQAVLQVQSPLQGTAWVAIETDEIKDSFATQLASNAGRIEFPVKAEYAPNATVSVHLTTPGGPDDLPIERFAYTNLEVHDPARHLTIKPEVGLPVYEPRAIVEGTVTVTNANKPVENAEVLVYAVDDALLELGTWQRPDIVPVFFPYRPFGVETYNALANLISSLKDFALTQKGFIIGDGGAESVGNVLLIRSIFRPLAFWSGNLRTNKEGVVKFSFETPDNLTTYRVCSAAQTKEHQFGFGDTTFKVSKSLMVEPALPRFLRHGDLIELRAVIRQNVADAADINITCETEGALALDTAVAPSTTHQCPRNVPTVARFRARVAESGTSAKVRFLAKGATAGDAVEIALPVVEPFVLRRETQGGRLTSGDLSLASMAPVEWQRGVGRFYGSISTSPWMPKLNGLPQIYEYPHGCLEQISSRLLVYSMLGSLLDYLPHGAAARSRLNEAAAEGLKKYKASLLPDGTLPYWPGAATRNAFITAYVGWTIDELRKAGAASDETLWSGLRGALVELAVGRAESDSFSRSLAMMALAEVDIEQEVAEAASALYRQRESLNDEARGLLAVALHRMNHEPAAVRQLLAEIAGKAVERAFDPQTFGSTTRADAIRIYAHAECTPGGWKGPQRDAAEKRLLATMDSAAMLSTQENLWTLVAFKSLVASKKPTPIKLQGANLMPHELSANKASVAWQSPTAAGLDAMLKAIDLTEGYFVLTGHYALPERETPRVDRGFRIERLVKNLTAEDRTGTKEKPYRLGDTLLVTYRLIADNRQYYVALEDSLPAGIETINPNISSIGEFFELPQVDDPLLDLSHTEIRDKSALLYFDRVEAGPAVAMTLARVTSAGEFIWPATTATPMYDARVSGLSASSMVYAVGE